MSILSSSHGINLEVRIRIRVSGGIVMKRRSFPVFCLATLIITTPATIGNSTNRELQQIAAYRQWQPLAEKPMVVSFPSLAG